MIGRFVGMPLLLIAALSCDSLPTEVPAPPALPEAGGLRLDGSISSTIVPVGKTHVLTFRLRNLTEQSMTLHFSSGCQITPFIETRSGEDVYPQGGGYACTTALTSLTIEPGGEVLRPMRVHGGPPSASDVDVGLPIPRGRYRAYAILEPNSSGVKLRSESVEFEVR